MSSFQWYVRGWMRDDAYLLTADDIYKYLMQDIEKAEHEWFIPPREILKISNIESFPKKISKDIKDIIMDKFPEIFKK